MVNQYAKQNKINQKTHFTVMQYLAEAYCMIDDVDAATNCLNQAQELIPELDRNATKFNAEQQFNNQLIRDKISPESICLMNKAALELCRGDLVAAKK